MAKDVPTPVITASLHAGEPRHGDFTGRVLQRAAQPVRRHSVRERAQEVLETVGDDVTATGEEVDENPLCEGLERLPVHPTTLTIFGRDGDLSRRKLCRRSTTSPTRARCPGASTSSARRARTSRTRSSATWPSSPCASSRAASRRGPAGKLFADVRYVAGSFDQADLYDRLRETCEEFDEGAGLKLNRASTSRRPRRSSR
jgi:hypothetical protein